MPTLLAHSRVLEHVLEDGRPVRESKRVLSADGGGVLDGPVDDDRPETYEDLSLSSPWGPRRRSGQRDDVRVHGRDHVELLRGGGSVVEAASLDVSAQEARTCGLRPGVEWIHRCRPQS